MATAVVVVVFPVADDDAGLGPRPEAVEVEAFVADAGVERFDVAARSGASAITSGAAVEVPWRLRFRRCGMIESFWGRMQTELLNRKRWKTRTELANAIFDYLEILHNRRRRHSALGLRTPIEFELPHQLAQPVA